MLSPESERINEILPDAVLEESPVPTYPFSSGPYMTRYEYSLPWMPTNTDVDVDMLPTSTPEASTHSQAHSRRIRCWGSIDRASRGEMPKNEASKWSTWPRNVPICPVSPWRVQTATKSDPHSKLLHEALGFWKSLTLTEKPNNWTGLSFGNSCRCSRTVSFKFLPTNPISSLATSVKSKTTVGRTLIPKEVDSSFANSMISIESNPSSEKGTCLFNSSLELFPRTRFTMFSTLSWTSVPETLTFFSAKRQSFPSNG